MGRQTETDMDREREREGGGTVFLCIYSYHMEQRNDAALP